MCKLPSTALNKAGKCLGVPPNSSLHTNPLALIPFILIQILIPQVTQVEKKSLTTYTNYFSLIKFIAL